MVKIFRRPLPILAAALAISCALTAFWILKLEWTLPWLRLFDRPDSLPLDALMVQNNTLPRMAMALLAGGSTATATMLMQQLMRNPLASDSTLAVSSGAQAALVAATVFAPSFLAYGTSAVAFAGAAAALGAVLRLSARRALQPLSVVLAGLVVSLYLGSLTGIVMLFFSEETRGVMQWGSGSLVQDSWRDTLGLLWRIAVAAILTAFLIKPLNIMSLGDTQAESAGIPVKKIRLLSLAVAAFLSAGVVGFVGMMGFVGLAAATLVRQMGVRTLSMRLICSFIIGALLLMLTDNGLMLLKHYRGTDLPAGAVTALVGAPLLLWLTAKAPPRPSFQTTSDISTAAPHVPRLLHFLLLIAVAVSVLAFTVGRYDETLRLTIDPEYFVFRYPRVLLAAATGTMLALTGVILQRLTQNPMAGSELLGISSGTAFGAMSVVMLFGITSGSGWFWLTGIVSALVSLGLLMLFNRKNGFTPEKILLTGMALAALADCHPHLDGNRRFPRTTAFIVDVRFDLSGNARIRPYRRSPCRRLAPPHPHAATLARTAQPERNNRPLRRHQRLPRTAGADRLKCSVNRLIHTAYRPLELCRTACAASGPYARRTPAQTATCRRRTHRRIGYDDGRLAGQAGNVPLRSPRRNDGHAHRRRIFHDDDAQALMRTEIQKGRLKQFQTTFLFNMFIL